MRDVKVVNQMHQITIELVCLVNVGNRNGNVAEMLRYFTKCVYVYVRVCVVLFEGPENIANNNGRRIVPKCN